MNSAQSEASAPDLPPLAAFDFQPRTRLIFGPNTVERIGELASSLGRRALLVTDRGIVAAGHANRVQSLLEKGGLSVACFDAVQENPGTNCVAKCVEVARKANADVIVGLGGGSSMDTAKGCNFILTNGGRMQDYQGIGKATRPMLPLIAIPTTGGTGSECQSFALITDETTHQKMACGDPKAAAKVAILDPLLTVSQPARVTACTGIDAIAHAVETAVTRRRTPVSTTFAREAFRLCMLGLPRVLDRPDDLEARGYMLLGAALAGLAIENSMLGAAHSAANPLTAHFGIVHGQAVGLMLPHVVRLNATEETSAEVYARLAKVALHTNHAPDPRSAAEHLASHLEKLLDAAKLGRSLARFGVDEARIPMLAAEASRQWTAQFNPVAVSTTEFEKLYRTALTSS